MRTDAYQYGVCNRSYAVLEFPIEEVAQTCVLFEVIVLYLVKVTTECFGV